MKIAITKSSLSRAEACLLHILQQLNFGRIERLQVRNGQPDFDPPPKIVQRLKIGAENGVRPELELSDFRLKQGLTELFDILQRLGDGEIRIIEVRHGLPVGVELQWDSNAAAHIGDC